MLKYVLQKQHCRWKWWWSDFSAINVNPIECIFYLTSGRIINITEQYAFCRKHSLVSMSYCATRRSSRETPILHSNSTKLWSINEYQAGVAICPLRADLTCPQITRTFVVSSFEAIGQLNKPNSVVLIILDRIGWGDSPGIQTLCMSDNIHYWWVVIRTKLESDSSRVHDRPERDWYHKIDGLTF